MNLNLKKNSSINDLKSLTLKKNIGLLKSNSKDDPNRKNKVSFEKSYTPSLNIDKDLLERYTPNTDFDDYPQEIFNEYSSTPDLAFICKLCNNHISIEELNYHEKFHDLLNFFGFKETPENEGKLNEKRLSMIKSLAKPINKFNESDKNKITEWNLKITLINENYELLKSFLNNSFESNRVILNHYKSDVQGESRVVANEKILAIGSCSIKNSHKKIMEDTNIILDSFGENSDLTYIGTFDGYDGDVSSNKCESQLHLGILNAIENNDPSKVQFLKEKYEFDEINNLEKYDTSIKDDYDKVSSRNSNESRKFNLNFENESYEACFNEEEESLVKLYRYAFKYAYREMDKLLARGKGETSRIRWSGTTACSCIIEKKENSGWIHIANCGDVQAILVINNLKSPKKTARNHKVLTTLHTLNDYVKDLVALEKRGCQIIESSSGHKTICGLYSITRGLGFHGDNKIKKCILPKPSVRSYKIEENHVALIIATKGLWNFINYEKVADIVLQMLPSRKVPLFNERPASPSVKTMLHQYYINRNKEKSREKSLLQTVQDNNEVDFINLNENENEKYESNESINSKIDKNSKSSNVKDDSTSNRLLKESAKLEFNDNDDTDPELEYSEKDNSDDDKHSEIDIDLKIKQSDLKVVQVNSYELNKFHRKVMDDRNVAKRLDLSELIVETLVSSALKAGSTDNITINCILLPGCKI
ncbi:unnamed protein product [Brachionus calyciflorus]|uniref:PPM-type phosphatase domain-containing protein n=1 Tax=Brachionus calyciflorus TaxID=104777 RepID=A0A813M228_9BILA|nr:unnamed protein product [Brachionus calyciflorus]